MIAHFESPLAKVFDDIEAGEPAMTAHGGLDYRRINPDRGYFSRNGSRFRTV